MRNVASIRRKEYIRKAIHPGDQKSLWSAVNKSQQLGYSTVPDEVELNNKTYMGSDRPSAFAEEFQQKIKNIIENTTINNNAYQGKRLVDCEDTNFFTENEVMECLKDIKSKTCQGYDRIPQRLLRDGAIYLCKPITKLLQDIYETREYPEQWLISKITPIHKKGIKSK